MNWVEQAKLLFQMEKPEHFTNHRHCCECAEHDETLVNCDVDSIGLEELGNPGWDPICFCSDEGKKYYLPAFIRLSLATLDDDFYLDQFLFHLEWDGEKNSFFLSCSAEQRKFIAAFIRYIIENFAAQVQANLCADKILRVYEIWSEE